MKGLKPLTIAFRAILLLGLAMAATNIIAAQAPPVEVKIDPMSVPDITVQSEDYAIARRHFHTDLLQKGPAPYQECTSAKPPVGITEIKYASGSLQLKAWISRPTANDKPKSPAVLFLHGGFCLDTSEWEDSQPFRD